MDPCVFEGRRKREMGRWQTETACTLAVSALNQHWSNNYAKTRAFLIAYESVRQPQILHASVRAKLFTTSSRGQCLGRHLCRTMLSPKVSNKEIVVKNQECQKTSPTILGLFGCSQVSHRHLQNIFIEMSNTLKAAQQRESEGMATLTMRI